MNSQKNIDLITIILQAKKGKQRGSNQINKSLLDRCIFLYIEKISDKEKAEYIAIESFTKIFNKLELYKQELDFRTWLIVIAQNTMLDHIRKTKIQNISLDQPCIYERLVSDLTLQEHSPEESLISKQGVKQIQEKLTND